MPDHLSRNQAAGYIFEKEIMRLLSESGYVEITQGNLQGRGTDHQIDAYGKFSIPTPFIYPIRLIAEAKCQKDSVGLEEIRSFFGVITDISEYYSIGRDRQRNTADRFSDTGCIFSAGSFSPKAQDFAWAHNIFIVSFSGIPQTAQIIENIRKFTDNLSESILEEVAKKEGEQKEELWKKYQTWLTLQSGSEQNLKNSDFSILVGIIDDTYPVIVVGDKGWYKEIRVSCKSDIIKGRKTNRSDLEGGSLFEIDVEDRSRPRITRQIFFTLPDVIAGKIKSRIDQSKSGDEIFDLDIPLIVKNERETTRRIIKIKVRLINEYARQEYLQKIKGDSKEKQDSPQNLDSRITVRPRRILDIEPFGKTVQ